MAALCERCSHMSICRGATVALLSLVIVTVAAAGLGTHLQDVCVCTLLCVYACVRVP